MTAPDVNGFGAYIREVDAQGVTRIVGGKFFTQEEISTGPTALYEASSGWPKASREAMLLFGTAMDVDRRGGLWMTTTRSFDPDGSDAGPALLRLKSALPGYGLDGAKIPREGGGLVDVFSASGKHASESEQRLASGRWFKQRAKREAELADPEDPMSWTRLRGEQWAGERGPWVSELVRDERRVVRTSPLGRTSWTVYDAQGRVIERGAPGVEPTRYSYDAQGRVTERVQGARRVEARYGADGLVEELEDALGQITKLTRDAVGRPTQVEEVGTGRVWGQAYDAQGQRTMLTPPGSGEHVWSYSAVGRLVASALPEAAGRMAKLLWRYDRDGLPVEATQEDGSKAQRVYDAAGRLERVTQARWAA